MTLRRPPASSVTHGTELTANNACGFLSIAGMFIEGVRPGLKVHRLALCNSGDTAGNRRPVVGYGAWAFTA